MRPHHLDLVVTDLERSLAFYRDVFGLANEWPIVGERGERVVYLSRPDGGFYLGLREKQSEGPFDRYALGVHHVALAVDSREEVDERGAWLDEHGVEIESGPEEYDYSPGYYAVFFYDPDGIKLEILHSPEG
ncbi:MAG TPA: VOC family protein [Gaiellaceae bacterium]